MADVQKRRLGRELRRLREAAGLDQEQAAEVLERDQTAISRLELGRRGIRPGELTRLLKAYGVTDSTLREELAELAKAGTERPWYAQYASSLSPNYASFISFEGDAIEIHGWENAIVHGLLQTEDYAREVICGIGRELDAEEVERRVEIRMARQQRIARSRPHLWVIMDESTLLRVVGNRDVMRTQLQHLIDTADEPHVTIQVVPLGLGAHPGVFGPMSILKFRPPDDDVTYLETSAGDIYPVGDVARACRLAYDHLRAFALDPSASKKRIAEAMGGL